MIAVICDENAQSDIFLPNLLHREEDLKVEVFDDYTLCTDYLEHHLCDMIFISIDKPEHQFAKVVQKAKEINHGIPIALIGDAEEDSVFVYRYECDKLLNRPLNKENIRFCLDSFRLLRARTAQIQIKTFGTFEIFVNDKPVSFRNLKAKELLALCVDRAGSIVRTPEAVEKLWPGRPYDERTKRLYRKSVMSIHETLEKYNIAYIFHTVRGGCMINTCGLKCDLYSFMNDPGKNLFLLNGRYMEDYEWSEETLAHIIRLAQKFADEKELEFLYQ